MDIAMLRCNKQFKNLQIFKKKYEQILILHASYNHYIIFSSFWGDSFRIVEIKKVGRDSERARGDLSNAYNYFSVTQF